MLTLYGFKGSGSAAAEVALEIVGVAFRIVDAATWEPTSALKALERLNALTQIPTLVLADGSVMTESAAILMHLGLEYPASGLLPADPGRRAQALRGLVYIAANCYSAVSIGDFPERWCSEPDEPTNERIRQGTRLRLHHHWDLFADAFAATPWLGGDALGALDLLAAVVSKWSGARAHLRQSRPEFFATLERIEAHPAVAPVFGRHWPG